MTSDLRVSFCPQPEQTPGGGAVYFTKQNLDTNRFDDAIQLIQNDDDAYWCGSAQASIVQDKNGAHYCAIAMPRYQVPEPAE